jgi:CDP-diacylglycerol---serine O-phosphatidyltransferase
MKQHLPNAITLINLWFGCVALVHLLDKQYEIAAWCIVASLIADFLDGFLARQLGVASPIGKELDSLADVISFGAVPGAIVCTLLAKNIYGNATDILHISSLLGFIVTAFSALRLAKFNLDTRQSEGFIGLNTPANTIFWIGILFLSHSENSFLGQYLAQPWVIYGLAAASCYLLVAEIPMFSFKFKHFGWNGNEIRFIFAALSVLLLVWLKTDAISLIIVLYILFSIVKNRSREIHFPLKIGGK